MKYKELRQIHGDVVPDSDSSKGLFLLSRIRFDERALNASPASFRRTPVMTDVQLFGEGAAPSHSSENPPMTA